MDERYKEESLNLHLVDFTLQAQSLKQTLSFVIDAFLVFCCSFQLFKIPHVRQFKKQFLKHF